MKRKPNQCGNCLDGKLLMPGEMCGQCGNREPARRMVRTADRQCVYCGCTDSRACAGGCAWAVLHPATRTGVCTSCVDKLPGIALGRVNLTQPVNGKLWMQVTSGPNAGEGGSFKARKLIAMVEEFFKKQF